MVHLLKRRARPMTKFCCSNCGTDYEVDDTLAGKGIRCRMCGEFGKVPTLKPTPIPSPTAPVPRAVTQQGRKPFLASRISTKNPIIVIFIGIGLIGLILGIVGNSGRIRAMKELASAEERVISTSNLLKEMELRDKWVGRSRVSESLDLAVELVRKHKATIETCTMELVLGAGLFSYSALFFLVLAALTVAKESPRFSV